MANPKLLLLEDITALGKKGEIVSVKPGYARNFLLPKRKGLSATRETVKLQERLKEERAKQAVVDKKESEELAKKIAPMTLMTEVRVDQEGHLYGSVSQADIAHLFEKEGVLIDKRMVNLKHPIRKLGEHKIELTLKEGVAASCQLIVSPDHPLPEKKKEEKLEAPVAEEEKGEEEPKESESGE